MKQDGEALALTHSKFAKDLRIVLAVLKSNADAYIYESRDLHDDLEIRKCIHFLEPSAHFRQVISEYWVILHQPGVS